LEDTLDQTPAQAARRQSKIDHRAHVSQEHAKTRGMVIAILQVLRRGFFGRMKWLLFGR
jgi:hypothetical protein